MQIVTGIVLLLQFCLAGVVGVRLLRIPVGDRLSPERCLGWFFLVANLFGGVLITAAYGIWSSRGQAESSGFIDLLHAVGQLSISFGYAMVLLFTQRTFYPRAKWASIVSGSVIAVLVVSLLGRGLHEGFAISLEPGPFHWIGYYCRLFALLCAATASFAYWSQMKRRARLGLADPLVANRFLLWGLWAVGNVLMAFAEPVARSVYAWLTGADGASAQSIQQVGGSLITITLCVTSLFSLATTALLFLAFFPTDRYRSWIAARATSRRG